MSIKEIKEELNKQNKNILIKHILELYKKYDPVKEYFDFYINPNEEKLLNTYKEKVREGFFPKRGMRLRLSLSRKAINEFKKLEVSNEKLGDLLLYYIECGMEFISSFGDISESFYNSAYNTLTKALKMFKKENVLDDYKERMLKLLEKSKYSGYGFEDDILAIYDEFYSNN